MTVRKSTGTKSLWTAKAAAKATRGQTGSGWSASGVSIDTRTLQPGDLFVALQGPNRDGHDFVADALDKGAVAAMVHRAPDGVAPDHLLVVDDTQEALERLGRARRKEIKGQVAGVTGSVGKTGTKEMIRLALEPQGVTHHSVSSYNNHWGVPLTLARMPKQTEYAVLEMGMNHAGELTRLTAQARPHVAVITAIAPAHIQNFDSIEGIADAKAEIFLGLEPGGVAVVNRDSAYYERLRAAAKAAGARNFVSFGAAPEADIQLEDCSVQSDGTWVFVLVEGRRLAFKMPVLGRHWASNSLAALAVVKALGADLRPAVQALSRIEALRGRGRQYSVAVPGGAVRVIDESYNANPESMRAAISVLATGHGSDGRRIAVLGDMLELGTRGPELHAGLAPLLSSQSIDSVYTAGEMMRHLRDALPVALHGAHGETADEIITPLLNDLRPGDVVMIKGSLGSRMGKVVDALLALDQDARDAADRAPSDESDRRS